MTEEQLSDRSHPQRLFDPGDAFAESFVVHGLSIGRLVFAHHQRDHHAGDHHHPGDGKKRRAPAYESDRPGKRRRGEQRSKRADAELEPDQRSEPFRRIAFCVERERRHQIAARADTHQDTRRDQHARARADRELHRPAGGDPGANQHADFRAVTVKADAERDLRGREGEKERAG